MLIDFFHTHGRRSGLKASWLPVVFALLLTAGCATSPKGTLNRGGLGFREIYSLSLTNVFPARSQPVKITQDEDLTLMRQGYHMVGIIRLWASRPHFNLQYKTDEARLAAERKEAERYGRVRDELKNSLLVLAAERGGDVVRLTQTPEITASWDYEDIKAVDHWNIDGEKVKQVMSFPRTQNQFECEGTVWRYEPDRHDWMESQKITLVAAAMHGQGDVIRSLLEKGLSVAAINDNLHQGFRQVIDPLFRKMQGFHGRLKGPNYRSVYSLGMTPLHWAADNGNKEVVELLLAKGADVNAKADNGNTPLHLAIHKGNKDIVKLLISRGADINAKPEFP